MVDTDPRASDVTIPEPADAPRVMTNRGLSRTADGEFAKARRASVVQWLIALVIVSIIAIVLYPSVQRPCQDSPGTRCAVQLREIGQAMYIYAMDDPDEMFPDNLRRVVDAGDAAPTEFTCPAAPGDHPSYFYVPGASMNSAPSIVLMYEDPRNHDGKGGHVLFQDGHILFIEFPEYQEILDSNSGVAVSVTAAAGG
ncbi:MAG TPA: hypothetical protein P5081_14390 [Phycisphaerae bacterium]|nr:hypothetical protein [Phycisphaerae bacterium]HRW54059.1 hypothetical protein [Phycisphaerae bacterium]